MKSKKVFALLISLTILVNAALPGTLAASVDQTAANDSFTLTEEILPSTPEEKQPEQENQENQEEQGEPEGQAQTPENPTEGETICTCGSTDGVHAENCPLYEAPAEPENTCTCGSIDGVHAENCPLYEAPAEPETACTCGSIDGHAENCPLYEAPAEPEKTCACGSTDGVHAEGCPLYEAPAEPEKTCTCGSIDGVHAEGCSLYEAPAEPEKTYTSGSSDGTHVENCPPYVEQIELPEEVEIKYQVVGPENCGTLDSESERLLLPTTGIEIGAAGESSSAAGDELYLSGDRVVAIGAAPTAAEGFKFVGWYKDEACTQPVDESWVSDDKLIPGKTKNYGTAEAPAMGYEAATYYARFENETASLTIIRQRSSEETNENQHFIFDVTGTNGYCKRVVINGNSSITIKGLVAGEYTIKEVTGWSWRYRMDDSSKKITLQPAKDGTVDFSSPQNEQERLSGDAYRKITFGD